MNIKKLSIALTAAFAFSGCATITSNEMQTVSLNAKSTEGQPVEQAKCTLKNDKGAWELVAPGFVSIRRSSEDLMVECKKEGVADGFLRAVSRAAGGMWGNILFGGGIGAIIDHSKGTGYDYPSDLPVKMGTSVTVDRRDEQKANTAPTQKEDVSGLKTIPVSARNDDLSVASANSATAQNQDPAAPKAN